MFEVMITNSVAKPKPIAMDTDELIAIIGQIPINLVRDGFSRHKDSIAVVFID